MRKGTVELDILDYYKKLVDFLGEVLGENAEVVLRDCRKPDHCQRTRQRPYDRGAYYRFYAVHTGQ